jgi:hypothetical protein
VEGSSRARGPAFSLSALSRQRRLSNFSMCDVVMSRARAPQSEDVPRCSFIVAEPEAFFLLDSLPRFLCAGAQLDNERRAIVKEPGQKDVSPHNKLISFIHHHPYSAYYSS